MLWCCWLTMPYCPFESDVFVHRNQGSFTKAPTDINYQKAETFHLRTSKALSRLAHHGNSTPPTSVFSGIALKNLPGDVSRLALSILHKMYSKSNQPVIPTMCSPETSVRDSNRTIHSGESYIVSQFNATFETPYAGTICDPTNLSIPPIEPAALVIVTQLSLSLLSSNGFTAWNSANGPRTFMTKTSSMSPVLTLSNGAALDPVPPALAITTSSIEMPTARSSGMAEVGSVVDVDSTESSIRMVFEAFRRRVSSMA